ncbi:hypothetical protein, partial [Salmonella enterica]|uniref:hypothetical protein n=1 Tax=Salmonella enterica TaxID=28901 RepID=UPI001F30A999
IEISRLASLTSLISSKVFMYKFPVILSDGAMLIRPTISSPGKLSATGRFLFSSFLTAGAKDGS